MNLRNVQPRNTIYILLADVSIVEVFRYFYYIQFVISNFAIYFRITQATFRSSIIFNFLLF